MTFVRATESHMHTARLPYQDFLERESNSVTEPPKRLAPIKSPILPINQVVEILLNYYNNGLDWNAAFLKVLPHKYL
ncbi:unnamed protein product [Protopolystoma xenopodis]|uniref:tRNA (guanine(9)-N(1))-methyltransferase n=1 Tax=Protopolystoma xenopodis TaxID=117903 RepID=A0A448WVS2_9PLAT|nr:unnamed protein product [Protopolystoma xenopodis]